MRSERGTRPWREVRARATVWKLRRSDRGTDRGAGKHEHFFFDVKAPRDLPEAVSLFFDE